MAIAYAEEIGALYLETSAKDDTNVQDIFVKLSKCVHLLVVYVIDVHLFDAPLLTVVFGCCTHLSRRLSAPAAANVGHQRDSRHQQQRRQPEQRCAELRRVLLNGLNRF